MKVHSANPFLTFELINLGQLRCRRRLYGDSCELGKRTSSGALSNSENGPTSNFWARRISTLGGSLKNV
jgi:hypothetical protein